LHCASMGSGPPHLVMVTPTRRVASAAMSSTSYEALAAAVRQAFSSRGPMTEDELSDALVADGIDLGPEPEDMLAGILDNEAELFLPLGDERWTWLPG
jgi:hypothetical protein